MSKIRIFMAASALAALAACSTTQQATVAQAATRAQIAVAKACPVAKTVVSATQSLPDLSTQLQADLKQANGLITTACAGNQTLDTTTAQSLVDTGIPAMVADVNATTMPDSTKQTVVAALEATRVILQVLLAQP